MTRFQLILLVPDHDVTKNLTGHRMHIEGRDGHPALHCGEGGFPRPVPPRKNDQNHGEVAGQIRAKFSIFSNRGNQ